jgi:hypothetical protein
MIQRSKAGSDLKQDMPPRLEDTKPHQGNNPMSLLHCAYPRLGVFVAEKVFFGGPLEE